MEYSLKKILIPRHLTIFLLLGIGIYVSLLIFYTFETLFFSGIIYIILIPISYFHYRHLNKKSIITNIQNVDTDEDVLLWPVEIDGKYHYDFIGSHHQGCSEDSCTTSFYQLLDPPSYALADDFFQKTNGFIDSIVQASYLGDYLKDPDQSACLLLARQLILSSLDRHKLFHISLHQFSQAPCSCMVAMELGHVLGIKVVGQLTNLK